MRARLLALPLLFVAAVVYPQYACQAFFPTEETPDPYTDFTDKANWEAHVVPGGTTLSYGVFDGRYVYFGPFSGNVERYDTQQPYNDEKAWEAFSVSSLGTAVMSYSFGVAFDGTWVYFIQNNYDYPGDLVHFRYNTKKTFRDLASWESFDATKALGGNVAKPYAGAVIAGKYLYVVPQLGGNVALFDTAADFRSASSWRTFDLTTVKTTAQGFTGALYDGRYIYYLPSDNSATADTEAGGVFYSTPDGVVVRYDTSVGFESRSAYETFDTAKLDHNAVGFVGGAFDGRYIYMAPYYANTGVVPRFDTQGDFTDAASWVVFNTTSVSSKASGFLGAGFDGRFVYFVPFNYSINTPFDGVAVRVDTTLDFTNPASWGTFDMQTVSDAAAGFNGAVFDGQYVYFAPGVNSTIMRFNARTPAPLPSLPQWHGSFL